MPTREWVTMTWEEARDIDCARAVAILPAGAIEAHGPHLPLETDVVIAEAMARAGATRLEAAGYVPLLLPPLAYTSAPFAAGFAGTISAAPATVTALILDIARSLTKQGVAALAVANAHHDPTHQGSIAAAVTAARAEGLLPIAAPDLSRKPWAPRLGEEFRSGACHAGRYEGSIVMASRPAAVRDAVRRSLPPNPASLSTAIREGKTTFEAAGGSRAYFGWPADATAEEGAATIAILGEILAEAATAVLSERNPA